MLHRQVAATLSALALALPASAVWAEHGHGRPGHHGPGKMLERHLDELGLEPEQREAIQALLDAAKQEREQHREQMRAAFEEMHALLDQDTPDENAVMRQVELIGELRTEGHKRMLHTLLAVRAELTPEQRAQLREKMKEDMRHHRRWKFFRRHGPPGEPGEGTPPFDEPVPAPPDAQ
jgi:Spy/CpxP family protein refolding chaperone